MAVLSTDERTQLRVDGYVVVPLGADDVLRRLEQSLSEHAGCSIADWHATPLSDAQHTAQVAALTALLVSTGAPTEVARQNLELFVDLLGPDLDIQAEPHLRVSRPGHESDLVNWHRDTFYGGTPWELKVWVPVVPLAPGAGLHVAPGSHLRPSTNLHDIEDDDAFRRSVVKGSEAHGIGFPYAPKTDDVLAALDDAATVLLAPEPGWGVLFLSSLLHRAQNRSSSTRVSFDLNIRNTHAPTMTRPGYYVALHRGLVAECAASFLADASATTTS